MLNHVDERSAVEALALVRAGAAVRPRPRARRDRAGVPGALLPPDARHDGPPRQRRRRGRREPRQLDHRAGDRHAAARHAPRRAEPPADRRPRLQRLDRRRARRHGRACGGSASRPCRRSSRAAGSSTSAVRGVERLARRRHRRRRPRRHRRRRPATRCSSTPAGARTGTTPTRTSRASPARAARLAHWLADARRRAHRLRHLELRPGARPRTRTGPFEVPQILNVRHGVFVVENLDTAALAADGVREFALILTHARLRGATGAWTSPIALV